MYSHMKGREAWGVSTRDSCNTLIFYNLEQARMMTLIMDMLSWSLKLPRKKELSAIRDQNLFFFSCSGFW